VKGDVEKAISVLNKAVEKDKVSVKGSNEDISGGKVTRLQAA
jgi:hypothetical protein